MQNSAPAMSKRSGSPARGCCAAISVQHESSPGVLKNRPLPSTVMVTLLGNSLPTSPDRSAGSATMKASCSLSISPVNRKRAPLPCGRSMFSQRTSSADQSTAVAMPPTSVARKKPLSPQVSAFGDIAATGSAVAVASAAGSLHASRTVGISTASSAAVVALQRFLPVWCNAFAFTRSERGNTTELDRNYDEKMPRPVGLPGHPL